MILLDTNVVIDIVGQANPWTTWSARTVRNAGLDAELAIDYVVLAELHGRPETAAGFEQLRAALRIALVGLSESGARQAGAAHAAYRRTPGSLAAMLPDFLIGGNAAALGAILITRDARRFIRYFPDLKLITPEDDDG